MVSIGLITSIFGKLNIDFLMSKNKNKIKNKSVHGSAKGMFKMKKNFDMPIEDFKDYA
jgi:hypothetical protein